MKIRCIGTNSFLTEGDGITQRRNGQLELAIVTGEASESEFRKVRTEWSKAFSDGVRFLYYYWVEIRSEPVTEKPHPDFSGF